MFFLWSKTNINMSNYNFNTMRTKIIFVFIAFAFLLNVGCGLLSPEIQQLEKATIFKVSEDQKSIVLDGVINSSAYTAFKDLAEQHPQIKRLEIVNCEGSINDEVNLKLAKYVHKNGFNTHLNDNGLIASGGTDLFLSGKSRTKGANTRIGVHSWAGGGGEKATDFPKDHKYHKPYIEYYKSVGFSQTEAEAFYFFTINAASPDDVHWMTDEEIITYKMISQ